VQQQPQSVTHYKHCALTTNTPYGVSSNTLTAVTLNNASDYQANGLLSDYIGWTNGLSDYQANGLTN